MKHNVSRARRPRALLHALVLLGTFASSAVAQQSRTDQVVAELPELKFVLPLEVGQGPRFDGNDNGFAYVAQFNVLPGLAYGRAELNVLGSITYQSPKADPMLGGRFSFMLMPFLQGAVGLRAAAQGAYAFRAQNADGAVGILGDLARILRLGLWLGRDFERERFYGLVTIGSDVTTWGDPVGAIVGAGPMDDVGDPEGP